MQEKINFAVNYLVQTVGATYYGWGKDDDRINKQREAVLCDSFERYVYGKDGDNIDECFCIGDDDLPVIYNGRHYEVMSEADFRQIIKQAMNRMNVGMVYQKNSHKMIVKECLDGLSSTKRCLFEPDRRYAVFLNCVLDIKTGEMLEFDRKYKTDLVLDFVYDPEARSGLWDSVIHRTIPDPGMYTAFKQFCGAFLVNRSEYKIEHLCLLVGTGRNGKSVVTDAISSMFGDELVSHFSPEDLFRSSQASYNLASINGKLANITDDVSNKDFSGGDFKQFTSGAKFSARHPYGRPFVVRRVPLMMCCVNEVPPTTDDTDGYFRRLLPIMCPAKIADDEVDTELPNKLSTDEAKCGIFNWILEGYKSLIDAKGKISVSDSIAGMKELIREDSNSARRWVRYERFVKVEPLGPNDENWHSMSEYMEMYKDYCIKHIEPTKTAKSIAKLFGELGFAREERRSGIWYCIGRADVEFEADRSAIIEDEAELPF